MIEKYFDKYDRTFNYLLWSIIIVFLLIFGCKSKNPTGSEPPSPYWRVVDHPHPPYPVLIEDFCSVFFISKDDGWVGGGPLLHYNGIEWEMVEQGPLGIQCLFFLSKDNGWALGGGHRAPLHYDGNEWKEVTNFPYIPPPGFQLHTIYFISPSDGWIVGEKLYGNALMLHYDGNEWREVDVPNVGRLRTIFFTGPTDGWAVAEWLGESEKEPPKGIMIHYDGSSWNITDTLPHLPARSGSIFFTSPNNGWAVGYGPYISHFDGSEWTTTEVSMRLEAIYFLSPDDGWGVGNKIAHYNGIEWECVLNTDSMLNAVYFVAPDDGWAVGWGKIYHYSVNP